MGFLIEVGNLKQIYNEKFNPFLFSQLWLSHVFYQEF